VKVEEVFKPAKTIDPVEKTPFNLASEKSHARANRNTHAKVSSRNVKIFSVVSSVLIVVLAAGLQSVLVKYKKAAQKFQVLEGIMENPNARVVTP
jgi:hypothetical protein